MTIGDQDQLLQKLREQVTALLDETSGVREAPQPTRIQELGMRGRLPLAGAAAAPAQPAAGKFVPQAPTTWELAGTQPEEAEALILKLLGQRRRISGAAIAVELGIAFQLVEPILQDLRNRRLLALADTGSLQDFVYIITSEGLREAEALLRLSGYVGCVPVPLADYIRSVDLQVPTRMGLDIKQVQTAFSDLAIPNEMLLRLARAIAGCRGMFLYGSAGNGKTSIAERITRAFGGTIWIPRAINAFGETLRLFDPADHQEVPLQKGESLVRSETVDPRWVRIERPTIIVGGEFSLEQLEVFVDPLTRVSDAPLHLKSNCGTLVIDDFGRQRMSTTDLLNRWIVPLEKKFDYLRLGSGRKIQVPFRQMVVFSTNLEPSELVDEAFLRRIPYKIQVGDPPEDDFRSLFQVAALKRGFECERTTIDHLIQSHYRAANRCFRYCHARDLMDLLEDLVSVESRAKRITPELIDHVVRDYFPA